MNFMFSCEILCSPLKHKIHIFSPPCNILFILLTEQFLVVVNVRRTMLNYLNYQVVNKMFETETLTEFFPKSKSRIDELYCK